MILPTQAVAPASVHPAQGAVPQSCSFVQAATCAAKGAGLAVGPCNPLAFPEGLAACIPAAVAYVDSCSGCLKAGAQTAICGAVTLAESQGINVPAVLRSLC